jgi:phenylacetate-CoA ligase
MPLIERIVGRTRSIFRFADGSSRWPDTKPSEINEILPHRKLQVVQTALDHLEVRIIAQSEDQVDDVEGLTAYFRHRLHDSLRISVRRMDDIPRSPSGKYFDFYSEVSG